VRVAAGNDHLWYCAPSFIASVGEQKLSTSYICAHDDLGGNAAAITLAKLGAPNA
jgi:hypothetical protein